MRMLLRPLRLALASLLVLGPGGPGPSALWAETVVPAALPRAAVSPVARAIATPLVLPALGAPSALAPAASLALPSEALRAPLAGLPGPVAGGARASDSAVPRAASASARGADRGLAGTSRTLAAADGLARAEPARARQVFDGERVLAMAAPAGGGWAWRRPGRRPALEKPAPLSEDQARAAVEGLGEVPAPRIKTWWAAQAAYWASLTGFAGSWYDLWDRPALMAVAAFMILGLGGMGSMFAAYAQQGVAEGRGSRPPPDASPRRPAPSPELWDEVRRIARSVGLGEPSALEVLPGEFLQARAGGVPSNYQLQVSEGVLARPADEREAVLRHELAHVRHRDGPWSGADFFLAAAPAVVALLGGAAGVPAAVPAGVAALTLWSLFAAGRHRELLADQAAAHEMGGPGPLIRFFLRDVRDPARAAEAARTGRPSPGAAIWRRAWEGAARFFGSHPSHYARIARLSRLARRGSSVTGAR